MRGELIQDLFQSYWANIFKILDLGLALAVWGSSRPAAAAGQRKAWISRSDGVWRLAPILVLGAAMLQMTLYEIAPNYADYGEPTIAILAGNLLHGAPVYGDWLAGQSIVGSNYGPYVFMAQALFVGPLPSIAASKLPGIVAAIFGLFMLSRAIGRHAPARVGLESRALAVLFYAFNLHYWFWNRPDSLLIALVASGCYVRARCEPFSALVWLGLLAGVASNLKLFGPIYLAPLAIGLLPELGGRRLIIAVAAGGALAIIALAFPFLAFRSFPFESYLSNILIMRHQGLLYGSIATSALYAAAVFAPTLSARLARPGPLRPRREDVELIALGVCMLAVAVISGKPGGGPPYVMPFVPLALYLAARLTGGARSGATTGFEWGRRVQFTLVLLLVLPLWSYSVYQIGRQLTKSSLERRQEAELRSLFRRHPDAEMAYGAERPTPDLDQNYRVEKAFLGQTTRFDYVNFGDQRAAGVAASVFYPLLMNCRVPTWISSLDSKVFDAEAYGRPMFDPWIRDRLRSSYAVTETGRFYEVWSCRR